MSSVLGIYQSNQCGDIDELTLDFTITKAGNVLAAVGKHTKKSLLIACKLKSASKIGQKQFLLLRTISEKHRRLSFTLLASILSKSTKMPDRYYKHRRTFRTI
jgi:hypothetical protein